MKLISTLGLLLFLSVTGLKAQWEEVPRYGQLGFDGAFSFVIDGKGYVGGGPGTDDFRMYDPENNEWTPLSKLPNGPRGWAFAFTIDGKGYMGGGAPSGFNVEEDFWMYEPASDSWERMADFGGGPRDGTFAFALNGKGYVGCGFDGQYLNSDVWEYDPAADEWTRLSDFPGGPVIFPAWFILDGEAYVGTGQRQSLGLTEIWKFNPDSKTWTKMAEYPSGRQTAVGFALGGEGYIGLGMLNYEKTFNDFYKYDKANNQWLPAPELEMPMDNTAWSVAFTIGDAAYAGSGAALPSLEMTNRFFKFLKTDEPVINLSDSYIDFGNVKAGSSNTKVIRINNSGKTDLNISELRLSGDDTDLFSIDEFPQIVAPGDSEPVRISFFPEEKGLFSADVTISSNAYNGELSFGLFGTGISKSIIAEFETNELNFPETAIGESEYLKFKVINTGEDTLKIEDFQFEANKHNAFSIRSQLLPHIISPSDSAYFDIYFVPEEESDYSSIMKITNNSDNIPVIEVKLNGKGKSASSLRQKLSGKQFSVGPNPAQNGKINIKYDLSKYGAVNDLKVFICDLKGNKIDKLYGGNNIKNEIEYEQNLPSGVYLVIIESASLTDSRKIVIK